MENDVPTSLHIRISFGFSYDFGQASPDINPDSVAMNFTSYFMALGTNEYIENPYYGCQFESNEVIFESYLEQVSKGDSISAQIFKDEMQQRDPLGKFSYSIDNNCKQHAKPSALALLLRSPDQN